MMDSRFKRFTLPTALLLALAIAQMSVPVSLAGSAGNASAPSNSPQQVTAILTTGSNMPITVNGASAITGATITTGAMIETPDQIGAAIIIPGHFTLDIAPNAKLTVEFERNSIKVNLIKGCVVLHTTKGTTGEIDTSRGVAGKTDGSKDDRIDVCDPTIASAPAAAAATGLTLGEKIAIVAAIGGALALIPILTGGGNPSPNRP